MFKRLVLFALPALVAVSTALAAPTAEEIVKQSDAIRNPDKPFSLRVQLSEFRKGKPGDTGVVVVYSKMEKGGGQYRSLIRFEEPAKDVGKLMLKDGNVLWFYDPEEKASVRISPQQRLLGQASNGDVVTINFQYDYTSKIVGEETITDADRQKRDCYQLHMEARNDSVTYHAVDYWVDKETSAPVKGKFYADSGRLLKTAYYRGYQDVLGKDRPTEIIILDGVDTSLITKLNYSDHTYRDIPETWFQKSYLPRFKPE